MYILITIKLIHLHMTVYVYLMKCWFLYVVWQGVFYLMSKVHRERIPFVGSILWMVVVMFSLSLKTRLCWDNATPFVIFVTMAVDEYQSPRNFTFSSSLATFMGWSESTMLTSKIWSLVVIVWHLVIIPGWCIAEYTDRSYELKYDVMVLK